MQFPYALWTGTRLLVDGAASDEINLNVRRNESEMRVNGPSPVSAGDGQLERGEVREASLSRR